MTTRPQLASPPAMAVFTRGELAIANPTRRADSSLSAPLTSMRISFLRAFAVTNDLKRKIKQKGVKFPAEVPQTPITRFCDVRMGGTFPVAKTRRVSFVEVSPSTVIALNEFRTPDERSSWSNRRGKVRVRENKSQERRHVGRDHAGTLGNAIDGHAVIFDHCTRSRHFGKRVGRHDGFRCGTPAACGAGIGEGAMIFVILCEGNGSPITPVDATNTSLAWQSSAAAAEAATSRTGVPAGGAGECIGISAIGDERAGCPLSQDWLCTIRPKLTPFSTV